MALFVCFLRGWGCGIYPKKDENFLKKYFTGLHHFGILIAWAGEMARSSKTRKDKTMLQAKLYDCADRRNSRLPNFLARRVLDLAMLCARSRQGEFYFRLVRLVSDYSIFFTGV